MMISLLLMFSTVTGEDGGRAPQVSQSMIEGVPWTVARAALGSCTRLQTSVPPIAIALATPTPSLSTVRLFTPSPSDPAATTTSLSMLQNSFPTCNKLIVDGPLICMYSGLYN